MVPAPMGHEARLGWGASWGPVGQGGEEREYSSLSGLSVFTALPHRYRAGFLCILRVRRNKKRQFQGNRVIGNGGTRPISYIESLQGPLTKPGMITLGKNVASSSDFPIKLQ